MKYFRLAFFFAALTFASVSPVIADEQTRLIQNSNLFPITPEQISKYGALKVYQSIWKAIDKSSTSNFIKTKEWKDLFDKPPIEICDDNGVRKAISILYSKTGDTIGSTYTQDINDLIGEQNGSVCTSARRGKIGYIRLSKIPVQAATSQIKFALLTMPDIDGLILDLRGNRGGNVVESLEVASLFCKGTVSLRTKSIGGEYDTNTKKGTAIFLKPLVVLIDADTISGGEILANILKEQCGSKLLGIKTGGKTSIRALTATDFGYIVAVKIAEVVHKDNSPIENKGVAPDIALDASPWWKTNKDITASDSKIFSDKLVKAAVKELKNEIK